MEDLVLHVRLSTSQEKSYTAEVEKRFYSTTEGCRHSYERSKAHPDDEAERTSRVMPDLLTCVLHHRHVPFLERLAMRQTVCPSEKPSSYQFTRSL